MSALRESRSSAKWVKRATLITDGLFVGDMMVSKDVGFLRANKISAIYVVGNSPPDSKDCPPDVSVESIPWKDENRVEMEGLEHLIKFFDKITERLKAGLGVLLCCPARSQLVYYFTYLFLMRYLGWSLALVNQYLTSKQPSLIIPRQLLVQMTKFSSMIEESTHVSSRISWKSPGTYTHDILLANTYMNTKRPVPVLRSPTLPDLSPSAVNRHVTISPVNRIIRPSHSLLSNGLVKKAGIALTLMAPDGEVISTPVACIKLPKPEFKRRKTKELVRTKTRSRAELQRANSILPRTSLNSMSQLGSPNKINKDSSHTHSSPMTAFNLLSPKLFKPSTPSLTVFPDQQPNTASIQSTLSPSNMRNSDYAKNKLIRWLLIDRYSIGRKGHPPAFT